MRVLEETLLDEMLLEETLLDEMLLEETLHCKVRKGVAMFKINHNFGVVPNRTFPNSDYDVLISHILPSMCEPLS